MESRELLQFPLALIRNIEARRMLSPRRSCTFNIVFRGCLQAIKNQRFRAALGRKKISRHRFGGARGRHMLFIAQKISHRCKRGDSRDQSLQLRRRTYRCTGAYNDAGCQLGTANSTRGPWARTRSARTTSTHQAWLACHELGPTGERIWQTRLRRVQRSSIPSSGVITRRKRLVAGISKLGLG